MNKKIIHILIIIILFVGFSGGFYFLTKQNRSSVKNIVADIQAIPPHIITKDDYNGGEPKPEILKIREDIKDFLNEKSPGDAEYYDAHVISIKSVGKHYVCYSIGSYSGGEAVYLLDLKTGEERYIPKGGRTIDTDNATLLINEKSVYYYLADAPDFALLDNSELTKPNETYHSGGDMTFMASEKHTNSKISIDIFDSTKTDKTGVMLVKIRTETFTLPR